MDSLKADNIDKVTVFDRILLRDTFDAFFILPTWMWHPNSCLQPIECLIPYAAGLMMGYPCGDVAEAVFANVDFLSAAIAKWINCMT